MSQIVKLRRSAIDGKRPTNAQLELGELSINTTMVNSISPNQDHYQPQSRK